MKKKDNFCVLIFLLFIFLYTVSLSAQDIFIEDFITNSNDWPIVDNAEVATDLVAGSLSFEHKSDDNAYYIWYPVDIDTNRDFEIQS